MKKIVNLFFIASLFLIGFTSCEQQTEEPGGIPGMGETPGELEIAEPFVAPQGIAINLESQDETTLDAILSSSSQNVLKNSVIPSFVGCAGNMYNEHLNIWILVKLTITNDSDQRMCIDIPAGTVFEVSEPGFQNGIVVCPITLCLDGKSTIDVTLSLMCLNKGYDGSTTDVTYKWRGVTASPIMQNFCKMFAKKKCKMEDYDLSNSTERKKYSDIVDHIQKAIWNLTNDGRELTQDQIDYFNSLPDRD